jgi:hypothetical protein
MKNITRTLITVVWTAALLGTMTPAIAQVQPERRTPDLASMSAFEEDIDAGSLCPACQIVALDDVEDVQSVPGTPAYSPYASGNGWTLGFDRKRTSADVLVYDASSGFAWLVHTTPKSQIPLMPAGAIFEVVEEIRMRPGIVWSAGDLDADGRDDLIGHDKRNGDVIRMFRRGR